MPGINTWNQVYSHLPGTYLYLSSNTRTAVLQVLLNIHSVIRTGGVYSVGTAHVVRLEARHRKWH